jgi:hypothetical protein
MQSTIIRYILLDIAIGIGFIAIVVPLANASTVCEPGWSLFDGNCYKVILV